jgi:glycosyltransferase involved in cell wall biosynthesis
MPAWQHTVDMGTDDPPAGEPATLDWTLLLVISDLNELGGMETQAAHLASGLAASGRRVLLASIRSARTAPGVAPLHPAVGVLHLRAHGRRRQWRGLGRLVRLARRSDLVLCVGWDASLWGRLAAVIARRPAVMAEHTPGREHQVAPSGAARGRWIAAHNRLLARATAATVICAESQRSLLSSEGVPPGSMTLIPNGVPVSDLRRRAGAGPTRAALGIPPEAKVLVHVARFTPQKRQHLALDVVAALRARLGDVRLVFAGDGPELERVRASALERGADWAVFLGRVDNPAAVLALADLVILPSAGEAMPMSVVEAIAVGTPVVATAVGDVPALLERTGAGVSVPVEDVDGFVDACSRLLGDARALEAIGRRADEARREVDAATMVERYERVLGDVASGARAYGRTLGAT